MGVDPVLVGETGPVSGVAPVRSVPAAVHAPPGIADWRGDVALELWVETESEPPRVRLAGRLDASTAAHVCQVVHELLTDGTREIELCTEGLRTVDSSAVGALADIERQVRAGGGTLTRVGPPAGPFGRTRRGTAPARPV
jgi:anti-anti-sigma factor